MAKAKPPADLMVDPIPSLSADVDKLGALNAKLSKLAKDADAIKARLKLSGLDSVSGSKFRAVIVAADRSSLDAAKVKAMLAPTQISACLKVSRSVTVSLYDL